MTTKLRPEKIVKFVEYCYFYLPKLQEDVFIQGENIGSFIATWGQFDCIGFHQVFVCASLSGCICIVQVPENVQLSTGEKKPEGLASDQDSLVFRQLLACSQLNESVVDLKCGYFSSTMRQSIAILGFDKLTLFHVKERRTDLLTSSQNIVGSELLSHELEQQYVIELLATELAIGLVILNKHSSTTAKAKSNLYNNPSQSNEDFSNTKLNNQRKLNARTQQPHLPQRDLILIRYSNQFLFSVSEYRKVLGHFRLVHESRLSDEKGSIEQLAVHLGPMPIACLRKPKSLSLAIALSDNKVRSISLDNILVQSKQDIIRRVADNLLNTSKKLSQGHENSSKDNNQSVIIDMDLEFNTSWSVDLVRAPLELQSIQRCPNSVVIEDQLLVMTRYSIELLSGSGRHLWAQRFEAPLICCHSYTVSDSKPDTSNEHGKRQNTDQLFDTKLLTLVCTDTLSSDKCNMTILDEDQFAWSACFNSRPMRVWPMNLTKTNGILASIDINQGRISASYFGTNQEELIDEITDSDTAHLIQENLLDRPLFEQDGKQTNENNSYFQDDDLLSIDVKLEASNNWPNVIVSCCISLSPKETFNSGVLHDLNAVMEFDDSFKFECDNFDRQARIICPGVIQFNLGNFWSDRRESLNLRGKFTLRPARLSGSEAMDQVDRSTELLRFAEVLPKSLKVSICFYYRESSIGNLIQDYSFLLPISLISQLVHIDYSSGFNQSLNDVQSNLRPQRSFNESNDANITDNLRFFIDLFVKLENDEDIIQFLDKFIESDLICRGFNVESSNLKTQSQLNRRLIALENINLLAQSLDCRVKFRSQSNPAELARQSSEDLASAKIVLASIAMRMPSGNYPILRRPLEENINSNISNSVVWLHFCDLNATDSEIPEQLIKQHSKEWVSYETDDFNQSKEDDKRKCLLISVECDQLVPVLFIQNHMIDRLGTIFKKELSLNHLTLKMVDMIEISHGNLFKLDNFLAISHDLNDNLKLIQDIYDYDYKFRLTQLRNSLSNEYCKYHVSVKFILSICKRLSCLPKAKQQEFNLVTNLLKKCQFNLNGTLKELERMKYYQYFYDKLSDSDAITVPSSVDGRPMKWNIFERLIS